MKNRPSEKTKKNSKPARHKSLVSHISASYTKMAAAWISISLAVILLLVTVLNILFLVRAAQPAIDRIGNPANAEVLTNLVSTAEGVKLILSDGSGEIAAASFEGAEFYGRPHLIGFHFVGDRTYFNIIKNYILSDGQTYALAVFYDITQPLYEIMAAGAAAIVLFLISTLTIYMRGGYITRKAFGVVDELIVKAGDISSQNLNLRLNVNDSTDELVEFALTFNGMMDRIEKAYEKQKQFVSDASHELRTPIAVIQGYARMLERWGKDDKEILQESIDAISKESKNMQDLVDKLLFIARNDRDTLVLTKKRFNMSGLVQELVRDTELLETSRRIESSIVPDVILDGDRDQIKQALRIFVDNAIKYTEPGGAITISLEKDGGYAVAIVRDTGIGIPEKELPNIFDRFYRVDAARERDKGGHGLGLSIARIIVLRHGGRIKVASKPGFGTRFSIYLPIISALN